MIALDTHAWIWWLDAPSLLSARARIALEEADRVCVSVVSCMEVGMLVGKGKISLDRELRPWIRRAVSRPNLEAVPVSLEIATEAALLDRSAFPTDPADQLIYATAVARSATLITKDRRIREYDPRGTLW